MTQPTPSPLTREQIENIELSVQAGDARAISMLAQDVLVLTASHETLRLTVEQQAYRITEMEDQWRKTNAQYEAAAKAVTRQAQEIERLTKERAVSTTLTCQKCGGSHTVKIEYGRPVDSRDTEITKLRQQLAAMTTELTQAQGNYAIQKAAADEAEARWYRTNAQYESVAKAVTRQAEEMAQLQATLVAREETIRQLSVVNQYFAISEEALAKQRDALNVTCLELAERVTELEGDFIIVTEQRLALTTERDAAVQDVARLRAWLAMLEEEA